MAAELRAFLRETPVVVVDLAEVGSVNSPRGRPRGRIRSRRERAPEEEEERGRGRGLDPKNRKRVEGRSE